MTNRQQKIPICHRQTLNFLDHPVSGVTIDSLENFEVATTEQKFASRPSPDGRSHKLTLTLPVESFDYIGEGIGFVTFPEGIEAIIGDRRIADKIRRRYVFVSCLVILFFAVPAAMCFAYTFLGPVGAGYLGP